MQRHTLTLLSPRDVRVARGRGRMPVIAWVLLAGLLWPNGSALAQESDEEERTRIAAWLDGAERIIDAMDLERRYGGWVEDLVDDQLAPDTTETARRDGLVAALREGMPWDTVRARYLGHIVWVASEQTPEVKAPGVPLIVDDIVRYWRSSFGAAVLDLAFPPRDSWELDEAILEQFQQRFTPEEIAEANAGADTHAGRILSEFTAVFDLVGGELVRASERVFAMEDRRPR